VLRDSRLSGSPDENELARRIVAIGPPAVDAALEILVRGRVPEVSEEDAAQVLSQPQRTVLLAALARMPEAERAACVRACGEAAPAGDGDLGLAAVYLLGRSATVATCSAPPALAPRKPSDADALTRAARPALTETCTAILKRDPRGWDELQTSCAPVDDA
jgi:hypothetical protein